MLPESVAPARGLRHWQPQPAYVSIDPEPDPKFVRGLRLERDGESVDGIAGRRGVGPELCGKRRHRPPL
jgi:hypothetical protein